MYTKGEKIIPVYIEDEMKNSYIDYAMSVIVGRALPDIRDGLKPVHRRILYAMKELFLWHNKPYKKCARIIGETLGKYHPHGDAAIYDALVRMVQDFSLRYPLIDGQGNFGCFTKDTKIKLCDGRDLSFEELIKEQQEGNRHWGFTFDAETKKIEITEIKKPRLTRKKEKIIEVTLDNNKKIRCTLDHRFMLRGGSYKKASDLEAGDSLMPLYVKPCEAEEDLNLKGYEMAYQPIDGEWSFIHHLSDKWNLKRGVYEESAGRVRHHLDFNKLNNNPDNIRRIKWKDPSYKKRVMKSKILSHIKPLLAKHSKVTPEIYESERKNNGIPRLKKALNYFDRFDDMAKQAKFYNHKVVKTEILSQEEDVYDLTVEPWHNFALASGIFVHNSIDGDSAAASRYTEAKLEAISTEMLKDIDKDTVDFSPNFDNSLTEPKVLPTLLPNLLINGSSGIAVGMSTNVPPHNLGEAVDAVVKLIDKPESKIKTLMRSIKGPDFPTGGIICGRDGINKAYKKGRGKIKVRAKAYTETKKGKKESIIVTEIPYQVNKTTLIEQTARLIQDKKIEGISDLRDESSKEGIRIVLDLKKGKNSQVILNKLYKHTQLETTFGIIMLALVDNQPRILNLKQVLSLYIDHRKEIITRRTQYELNMAKARAHILEGLKIALKHLDAVIKTIKKSKNPKEAKQALVKKFSLTEKQAQAILEMQLQRLTNLERDKIEKEYLDLIKKIETLKSILDNPKKVLKIIKDEIQEIKKKYNDERRTDIIDEVEELDIEDLIAKESMAITISHEGYIKRMPVSSYKKQRRGGRGIIGTRLKEKDFLEHLFIASTLDYILFFTDKGKVYWLKVHEIPQGTRMSRGRAIVNLLQVSKGENITSFIPVSDFSKDTNLVVATEKGIIKKTELSAYSSPRKGGIRAIALKEKDRLISCGLTDGKNDIILATENGKAIRFDESQVRSMGRTAAGVKGIRLGKKDSCIGMEIVRKEIDLLTVTEKGYAKRTSVDKYRTQSRGGKGIINIKTERRNGPATNIVSVQDEDEIIVITSGSMVVRCAAKDVRSIGRNTRGVKLISLKPKDKVVSLAKIVPEEREGQTD